MARKAKATKSASVKPVDKMLSEMKAAPTMMENKMESMAGELRPEHKTFSHIMYVLFLIAVTVAAFFTFQSFRLLTDNPYFYGILGVLFLLWAFLFWEFGHRIHHVAK